MREPEDVASNNGCFVSESGHARIEGGRCCEKFFEGIGVPFSVLYHILC